MKRWNVLEKDGKISLFLRSLREFLPFFLMKAIWCTVDRRMDTLGRVHDPNELRLFISS